MSYDTINMWNLEKGANKHVYKTEIESQMQKTQLPVGKDKLGDWIDICTLLYIKWVTNEDLLYSTGNSTQYSVTTYMGK